MSFARIGLGFAVLLGLSTMSRSVFAETQVPGNSLQEDLAVCTESARPVNDRVAACVEVIESESSTFKQKSIAFATRGSMAMIPADGLVDIEYAIQLDPNNADAFKERGQLRYWIAYSQGLPNVARQSITDFDRAIELGGGDDELFYSRSESELLIGSFDAALADATRAIELVPGWALRYYWRGRIYIRLNQFDLALADFNKAIEVEKLRSLGPSPPVFRYRRYWSAIGLGYLVQGDKQQAVSAFDKAINQAPIVDSSNVFRFLAAKRLGQANALDVLRQEIGKTSPETSIAVSYGRLFTRETSPSDFLRELEQDGSSQTANYLCPAYFFLGAYYEQEGELKRASEFYTKAVETNGYWIDEHLLAVASLERLQQDAGE